jgi:hypothetical protein
VTVDDLDLGSIPLASENGTGPNAVRPRRSHRAQPKRAARSGRRRWPIVTTSLVVLLAVIIGGGYAAWRWSQDQYFVGASNGQVVIYRGVNQQIVGISLSKPYQQTGILLSQVPSSYQQTLKTTDAASNLADAQNIVGNVRAAVTSCREAYVNLQSWVKLETTYLAEVAQANKHHKPTKNITKPGPQPPGAAAMCPPSPAFGIAASDITPPVTGNS